MNNYEKVSGNFLTPMGELYTKKLNEYQNQAYIEELGYFTEQEIKGAVVEIRRKSKYFPSIAEAVAACYKVRDLAMTRTGQNNATETLPAYQKYKTAKDDAKRYVENYVKTATLWVEAEREGWSLALWRFIHAVACLQAQIMKNINAGWNKADIFGINYELTDETLHFWLQAQKEQASTGFISVAVPTGRIQEWKAEVKKAV